MSLNSFQFKLVLLSIPMIKSCRHLFFPGFLQLQTYKFSYKFSYIHSIKAETDRESDANRFLLVTWLKNGRYSTMPLIHESQVNKPAKNRFLLITRLKMAAISIITVVLSSRWICPILFLLTTCTDKKEKKIFLMEQLQSHIWGRAS